MKLKDSLDFQGSPLNISGLLKYNKHKKVRKIAEIRDKKEKIKNTADRALLWAAVLFLAFTAADYIFTKGNVLNFHGENAIVLMVRLIKGVTVAALIGGIADWYGVTSIFGRPFHIPYKTEIVLNRKDSFIESIKDFIGEDILSEKNVRIGFERLGITDRILGLIADERGKKEGLVHILSDFLAKLVIEILSKMNIEMISKTLKDTLLNQLKDKKPSLVFIKFLREVVGNRHFERVISKIAMELENLMKLKSTNEIVNRGIEMAILNYTEKAKGRGFVAEMVQERLKKAIFSALEDKLAALKQMDSNEVKELKRLFLELLQEVEDNELLMHKIDKGMMSFLQENQGIYEKLELFIRNIQQNKTNSEELAGKQLETGINYLLEMLLKEEQLLVKFEKLLTEGLIQKLNENRGTIKELVDKNLRVMSNRELVEFLQKNTEHELQYIRLNGMVFGTLIGFFITSLKLIVGI